MFAAFRHLISNENKPSGNRRRQSVVPRFETLEPRELLTGNAISSVANLANATVKYQPLDMTELAKLQGVSHSSSPTNLLIDFDGFQSQMLNTISAYPGTDQQLQDILFRTSEIFSPFNVQVSRVSQADAASDIALSLFIPSKYDNGDTVMFVGGDATNETTAKTKIAYSHTNGRNMDYPTGSSTALLNSHSIDWAYVDPMAGPSPVPKSWYDSYGVNLISQSIAHEAGHTFGLAHVRTDGLADPKALGAGTATDVMSYTDQNARFINQSFNITTWNYNGTTTALTPSLAPQWTNTTTVNGKTTTTVYTPATQNSYTYLMQVLGARPGNVSDHVVHAGSVGVSVNNTRYIEPQYGPTSPEKYATGTINRAGDYEVYKFTAKLSETLTFNARAAASGSLNADMLVYDSGGNLIGFSDGASTGDRNAAVQLAVTAGQTYSIVVGSQDADTTGVYTVSVDRPSLSQTASVPVVVPAPVPSTTVVSTVPSAALQATNVIVPIPTPDPAPATTVVTATQLANVTNLAVAPIPAAVSSVAPVASITTTSLKTNLLATGPSAVAVDHILGSSLL